MKLYKVEITHTKLYGGVSNNASYTFSDKDKYDKFCHYINISLTNAGYDDDDDNHYSYRDSDVSLRFNYINSDVIKLSFYTITDVFDDDIILPSDENIKEECDVVNKLLDYDFERE